MTCSIPADTHDEKQGARLFVVSAPSGAGKTTLCQAARRRLPGLVYSVSSTTRPPRHGELEGKDYFFVTEAHFREGIKDGQWAEWARVHDNYYGTSAEFLDDALARRQTVLLDIDVQGAQQIRKRYPDCITVFIMRKDDIFSVFRMTLPGRSSEAKSEEENSGRSILLD